MGSVLQESIIGVLQERQKKILERLPIFAKTTAGLALLGFAGFYFIRLFNQLSSLESSGQGRPVIDWRAINLSQIIAWTLSLVSGYVTWLFVFWSIAFIPYISYQAHLASRESDSPIATRPLRWLQLYAATFLPIALFAICWNSLAADTVPAPNLTINNPTDAAFLIFGAALIFFLIFLINRFIPVRLAAFRLSFFSVLLYVSLFLTYGRGVTIASHATVFGILLYLIFRADELSEIARRISLHDIDTRLADRFEQLIARYDDTQRLQDETHLTRKEHEAQATKQKLAIEIKQAESDLAVNAQLSDMRVKKLDLTHRMNQTQLSVIEKKIGAFGEVFGILSGEMEKRLSEEIPEQLEQLRQNVEALSPEQIQNKLNNIMRQISAGLQGIPESLKELRAQLQQTATEIETETKLIARSGSDKDDQNVGGRSGSDNK